METTHTPLQTVADNLGLPIDDLGGGFEAVVLGCEDTPLGGEVHVGANVNGLAADDGTVYPLVVVRYDRDGEFIVDLGCDLGTVDNTLVQARETTL